MALLKAQGVEYTIKMQTFHRMNEVSCERLGCVGMTEWGLRTRSIIHWCQSLGARPRGPRALIITHCSIIPLSSHFITSDASPDLISIMANLNIHGDNFSRQKIKKSSNWKCQVELLFQGWWIHLLILFRHPNILIMKCINFLGKNMSSLEWADEKKRPHVYIPQILHTWL